MRCDRRRRRAAAPVRRAGQSTMPVTKLVERVADAAWNAVSSTPTASRRRVGRGSSTRGVPCHGPRPWLSTSRSRYRATARRQCRPPRHGGRPRRGPARSATPAPRSAARSRSRSSSNTDGARHRHTRLTHTNVTGRPAAGKSRTQPGVDRAAPRPPRIPGNPSDPRSSPPPARVRRRGQTPPARRIRASPTSPPQHYALDPPGASILRVLTPRIVRPRPVPGTG